MAEHEGEVRLILETMKQQIGEEVEATVEMPNTVILVEKDSFTVGCAKNALKVTMIKPQGKREMSVKDYLLGKKINNGDVLTKDEH